MAGGGVAGDGKEPGREGERGVVAAQAAPGFAEGFLGQVFGVLAMAGEEVEEIEYLRLKTQNDLIEGCHAALCGQAGKFLRAEFWLV